MQHTFKARFGALVVLLLATGCISNQTAQSGKPIPSDCALVVARLHLVVNGKKVERLDRHFDLGDTDTAFIQVFDANKQPIVLDTDKDGNIYGALKPGAYQNLALVVVNQPNMAQAMVDANQKYVPITLAPGFNVKKPGTLVYIGDYYFTLKIELATILNIGKFATVESGHAEKNLQTVEQAKEHFPAAKDFVVDDRALMRAPASTQKN